MKSDDNRSNHAGFLKHWRTLVGFEQNDCFSYIWIGTGRYSACYQGSKVNTNLATKTCSLQLWSVCMICWWNWNTKVVRVTKQSLLRFKAHSTRWKWCLTLPGWLRTWDYISHGSSGKNKCYYSVKGFIVIKRLLITFWLVSCSVIIRKTSPCSKWKLTQRTATAQCMENEIFWSTQS